MGAGSIKRILVVGAGTMGHGIAELAAIHGYQVLLNDVSQEVLDASMERIRWSLDKLSEKGGLKEAPDRVLNRIRTELDLRAAAREADFVIEAVPERVDVKKSVFRVLDENCAQGVVLATNTSSLPISELAESTRRRDKVVGMHFFNPPVLMPLVEIVKSKYTSEETVDIAYGLAKSLGKQPVLVKKDVPGFVVNRMLARMINTACWLVSKGLASVEEVDATARYKLQAPMGFFELSDYVGIDVLHDILVATTQRGFKITPCPLVAEKYKAGKYGVKSGEGFYKHPGGRFQKPRLEPGQATVDPVLLIAPAVNEAAYLLREGVASKEDVDKSFMLGLGYPKGVLRYADEIGLDNITKALRELKHRVGLGEYEADPLIKRLTEEGRLGVKTRAGFYDYPAVSEKTLSTLVVRLEPPIAWVILNRPHRLNTITPDMINELSKVLDELEENEDVRVVVLSGAGPKAFSAGADVTSFTGITPVKAAMYSRRFQELTLKIEYFTKPVIAAINGYALGGGLEIAMSCDFRIASENAELGQPEINLGLIPGAGGTQRLPRLVGVSKAKRIIYHGERISAKEAKDIGLVDQVVPPDKLLDEARSLALKLSEKPPLALMAAKYAINIGVEESIWAGLASESWLFGVLMSTDDVAEGVSAFLEKRKPRFKGS